jgi:hypothetical protein
VVIGIEELGIQGLYRLEQRVGLRDGLRVGWQAKKSQKDKQGRRSDLFQFIEYSFEGYVSH